MNDVAVMQTDRSVAQFGRALRSGRRGRVFKSRRFDEKPGDESLRVFVICRNKSLGSNAIAFNGCKTGQDQIHDPERCIA